MFWDDWSLQRISILFVGLAFLMIGIQVTLYHYRQNFYHKSMWLPVMTSPLLFITGTALAWYKADWLSALFVILLVVGTLGGLVGFYYHFRGVGVRVGGWEVRNFLIGPPVILPLIFTALSVLGLFAVYWND